MGFSPISSGVFMGKRSPICLPRQWPKHVKSGVPRIGTSIPGQLPSAITCGRAGAALAFYGHGVLPD